MGIRKIIAGVATSALIASGLVAGTALGAVAAPTSIGGHEQTTFTPGRYVVTLVDDAAATYRGGTNGFAPTTPKSGKQLNAQNRSVENYSDYLTQQQKDVAATVGAKIEYSYTLALNGFSANLSAKQAAELSANKKVASIVPDELRHVTAVPSTTFLGLDGPDGVWASLGGIDHAGEGVVVGMLDTGIAPENPSFAGSPLGTSPGSEPYLSGSTINFVKGDGGTFTGTCETGVQFTASDCSTKIVGARYFVDGFGAGNIGGTGLGEYLSPRDGDGHGSHTSSTAAGDANVPASIAGTSFGTITGVAPAAKIATYKVCWTGQDPTVTTDDGCATSDILAAINAAIADGVDVINFSIGGGAAQTTVSLTDQAFLNAAAAGIFVSASAGNAGPGYSTLDNASPWITTVAASTIPSYEATVTLGNGVAMAGASVTVDMNPADPPLTGDLVLADSVKLSGAVKANLCYANTLDPALAAGKIVVCERGDIARVDKSAEVARAGGIGMILINVVPGSTDLDNHSVPTIHLDAQFHDPLMAYAATAGATATFRPGNSTGIEPPTPQVAGFSSRGPVLADGSDILKPDISAPGVAIIADGANAQGGAPTFQFLSGTSMAAPHIAGIAALYLGKSPLASPSEIKSAMMTTAYNTLDGNGNPVTDPFIQGAGNVDPTKYFAPGLLYLNGVNDWLSYIQGIGYDVGAPPINPSDLNLASIAIGALTAPETITRTVTATQAGTFTSSISVPGVDAVVSPSTLTFASAGDTASYTVTFTRTDAPLDTFTTGALTWTSGSTVVRSPIAIQPVTIVAPANAAGEGASGSVGITVTPGSDADIPLTTTGLSLGVLQPDPTGTETGHSGSGTTGDFFSYTVTVPSGTALARFDLDSIDNTADLDLTVYRLDSTGTPVAGWQSATSSADERVDIVNPVAADYLVYVDIYSANPTTAFDLRTYSVIEGGTPIGLDPEVIPGEQGVPFTYTASWSGLEAHSSYLGIIHYADTGAQTLLTVTTGDVVLPGTPINTSPPTISGTPEVGKRLTANPGSWDVEGLHFAYQWQADGVDIPGADSRRYRVASADQGKQLTVVVTATKGDLPPGTAVSAAVTVPFTSTTSLSLNRFIGFSWQTTTAKVTVTSGAPGAPTGSVAIKVNGTTVTTIVLTSADNGTATYTLPKQGRGFYRVQAEFTPDDAAVQGSTSPTRYLLILF
ncbi:MAG TPA: S8 family serine peptidase [Terrimesophilobacter sp.]|mgnify:FL=1|nr:S8 family serine peptidase [Terrimesophilobacter sp.]